jgi:hypothetical protein
MRAAPGRPLCHDRDPTGASTALPIAAQSGHGTGVTA